MSIEKDLCNRLITVLKTILPAVSIEGNWLPESTGLAKGDGQLDPDRMTVTVNPRSYDGYTTKIATVSVSIEGEIDYEQDPHLTLTNDHYQSLIALLDLWQGDMSVVVADMQTEGFMPFGFKLTGGRMTYDTDNKTRRYSQSFTIKARVA